MFIAKYFIHLLEVNIKFGSLIPDSQGKMKTWTATGFNVTETKIYQ